MIMRKIKIILLLTLWLFISPENILHAQVLEPVKWSFSQKELSDNEALVLFTAKIDKNWHLYSQFIPEGGPISTSFKITSSPDFKLVGKVIEPKPITEYDKNFEMNLQYFNDKVVFTQKIKKLAQKPFRVKGVLEFMTCDDKKCLPPAEVEFDIEITGAKPTSSQDVTGNTIKIDTQPTDKTDSTVLTISEASDQTNNNPEDPDKMDGSEDGSLWAFFFMAFVGGLIAILTPCVFPMIPMTVSFFMNDNANKLKARIQAVFYGFSIIAIYTAIGTVVAFTLGANFANFLSTHWIPNVFFFLIFVVFAASFFGAFEMTLPSWMINKTDQQADKGGMLGAFFMAFTLVLVSFSCTAPIVGSILVAAASGEVLKPIVGMLGFSLAFALPFTFFALSPALMSKLPKSGGWLNSVKVVLGFIELAFGLKFLSVADQTYHWGILDREIYLAFWIVIFALMGFYLLGKIKFAHDSEVKHVGVFRLTLVIITFTFVVYLIPGMWGAPLKALSGYLPPQSSHDFDLNQVIRENAKMVLNSNGSASTQSASINNCEAPRYADFLHLPHGLEGYFDYEQALACAKKQNKPIFIDFTGHGCVNCREMEARVWSDPAVLARLKEQFIVIALYVDDKTELPENEWVTSKYDGKVKKTIGKKYADFQISRFNVNAQPYYVLLDTSGNLLNQPKAYDLEVGNFVKFLDEGLAKFNQKK
jgi:thiol:disulfide interchange protein DsbD